METVVVERAGANSGHGITPDRGGNSNGATAARKATSSNCEITATHAKGEAAARRRRCNSCGDDGLGHAHAAGRHRRRIVRITRVRRVPPVVPRATGRVVSRRVVGRVGRDGRGADGRPRTRTRRRCTGLRSIDAERDGAGGRIARGECRRDCRGRDRVAAGPARGCRRRERR